MDNPSEHPPRHDDQPRGGGVIINLFEDMLHIEDPPDPQVWKMLEMTAPRKDEPPRPKPSLLNIHTILSTDHRWSGRIRLNLFDGSHYLHREDERSGGETVDRLSDSLETDANLWLQRTYNMPDAPSSKVAEAIRHIASANSFHPVREYLDGLEWDGVARLRRFLPDYCAVEDSPYAQEVGRRFLISAVARVMRPGCKVDTVLILCGKQGDGKSTAIERLFSTSWFSDTPIDIRNKDSYIAIAGVWGYEWAELDSTRKQEVTAVKAFISAKIDKIRKPYARNDSRIPRQVVFIGTTNERTFLNDSTGSRRFWPVEVGAIDLDRIEADRDQLWAEALTEFRRGEQWHLDARLEGLRVEASEVFQQVDPWEAPTREYLRGQSGVTAVEVVKAVTGREPGEQSRTDSLHMSSVLDSLGWRRQRRRVDGERVYLWCPPTVPRVSHDA